MSVPTLEARTIGEAWNSYFRAVVPADAHATQVEECKRAFYAGAQGMFGAMTAAASHDDQAVCDARLNALGREMRDFLRLFKAREHV